MPVTFQVVGNLADYGNDDRANIKVRATADPPHKIGDVAIHSNQPETVLTDEDGKCALTLVSVPGVWYRIQTPYSNAMPTVNLAGYVPDVDDPTTGVAFPPGTVIDLKDVVNEDPTPGYDVLAYLDDGALGAEADTRAAADAALDGRVDVLEAAPVVLTTDPRLSDARTPTAHAHTLDETTDTATRLALTPAERTKLTATSGTNTGDQVLPTFTTLANKPSTYPPTIGTTGATAVAGNDPRLNDARTPLTHVHPTSEVTGLDAALTGKAATVHTHTASQVSDSTTTGRALLAAADAAAARTTLALGTAATTDATAYATAAQGAKADAAATRAAHTVNVRDYGATGDGTTDDSAAIRSALATGKTVEFPRGGTYLVSREGGNAWALRITTAGQRIVSDGATIKLAATQPISTSVVKVEAAGVTISGLTIDGNRASQSVEANAQRHGIAASLAPRLTISDCTITALAGDGVMLYEGQDDTEVRNCRISDTGRAGVSMCGTANRVLISGNTIRNVTTQPVDSEPELDGGNHNVRVVNNYLEATGSEYAVTTTGRPAAANTGWIIMGNAIVGRVNVLRVNDVVVANNVIDGTAGGVAVIKGEYASSRVSIVDNIIKAAGATHAVQGTFTGGEAMTRWRMANNTITVETGRGVSAEGISSIELVGNMIVGTGAGFSGVRAQSSGPIDSVILRNNSIEGFTNAVYLDTISTNAFTTVIITGNRSKTVTTGVTLAGTAGQFTSVTISGNESTGTALSSVVVWVKTGGAGRYTYEGTGTPEGVLTAAVGSLAVRRDGGAATCLYVKETGTGNTGWVAK